ncbi:mitochondrial fission 1 protein-like [Branchiostoma floridae]|uniref:Mitochondrial fission 1 protein n=1 Tax=Branchiostoma floridae TaxID=7739 RepID=A0A9J7N5K4_BRAFL|nr:mitochondrial fission 1 protein-like [Branchiostoma floridae]
MEEVINDIVDPEDLKKFEKKYNKELVAGHITTNTQFEYAWALTRSKYGNDIKKGVGLLEELFQQGDEQTQRDYLYYLSIANFRLKDYEKALKYCRAILHVEPRNHQAMEMEKLIKEKMAKEGLLGMAIVGGVAAVALGGIAALGFAVSKGKS